MAQHVHGRPHSAWNITKVPFADPAGRKPAIFDEAASSSEMMIFVGNSWRMRFQSSQLSLPRLPAASGDWRRSELMKRTLVRRLPAKSPQSMASPAQRFCQRLNTGGSRLLQRERKSREPVKTIRAQIKNACQHVENKGHAKSDVDRLKYHWTEHRLARPH